MITGNVLTHLPMNNLFDNLISAIYLDGFEIRTDHSGNIYVEYEPTWTGTTDLYDILRHIPYFETLTSEQLVSLTSAILYQDRILDLDLERSLIYLIDVQYQIYMTHIYPIIRTKHEAAHISAMNHIADREAKKFLTFRLSVERMNQLQQMPRLPAEVCDYLATNFLLTRSQPDASIFVRH
jgi:hypothetical protein